MLYAVDAGHGNVNGSLGGDGGAVGYLIEQDCALDIASKVIAKLKALGHSAFGVRPSSASDVIDSLQKRCDASISADYLVSIHLNAGGGRGTEVFAMSAAGKELANKVLPQLVGLGFNNRGVKDGSNLYVIKHSKPVAILVEICFVDTETDANLYNQLGSEKIANAIVKGLTGKDVTQTDTYTQLASAVKTSGAIMALQYDLNIDYNAKLEVSGIADEATKAALRGIQPIICKGHKSNVVLWMQQKLIGWGYLGKAQATSVYDEATFQAITNLQKNWQRPTDGVMRMETWNIFLEN